MQVQLPHEPLNTEKFSWGDRGNIIMQIAT